MSRLLALVTDAFGGRGGIAQATRDLIGGFAGSGLFEVVEVHPRQVPDPANDLPHKVYQHPAAQNRLSYSVKVVINALRLRPDYVFCNHLYMAPLARIVSRIVGAKLVIQLHGIEIWSEPKHARRKAIEVADLLLCVSRDTRARALTHCDLTPERVVVVNNTLDPRFVPGDRSAARSKFGLGEEFSLLIVSRLDPQETYKGHERLLKALEILSKYETRPFVLLIAGEGADRKRLVSVAEKLKVQHFTRFLGQVPAADLPDLYRAADLFVLPSTGEGFGIVFLEAMACGTPSLGLSVGGVPDALADGELGLLADVEQNLASVLQNSLLAERINSTEIADAVQARFGPVVFERRLSSVLEALL